MRLTLIGDISVFIPPHILPGLLALGVAVAGDGMIVMLPFLFLELVWG